MIFAAALLAMALSGQPAKSPEKQRVPESSGAQVTAQSDNPKKTDQNSHQTVSAVANIATETSDTHAQQRDEQIEIERRVEIFTGLLVIAAFLQAGIFFWQGRVFRRTLNAINRQADIYQQQVTQMIAAGKQTDQLLDTMRDTAIRDQRAYVCLSSAVIEFRHERAPEVQVYMKNFGKTPAYDVRWWGHLWITAHPLREELPEPPNNFPMGIATMAPGGDPHPMILRRDPPIAEYLMPTIGTAQGTIYVYGRLTYRDAFGNPQFTNYRLMYGGSEPVHPRNKNGVKVALLKTDRDGNDAS